MSSSNKNQGEGDRESAKKYNKDQQEFVKSKKGQEQIKKARDIEDSDELRKAEQKGKARIKETDPAVRRDYKKPD